MQKLIFPFFIFAVLFSGCKSKRPADEETRRGVVAEAKSLALPPIEVGFNAKGNLNAPEQLSMTDTLLRDLSPQLREHMHIRVTGGTRSQRQRPSDWSDEEIGGWCDLQRKHGFGLVIVVNGNDTPESQADFVRRWQNAGANITFIELMNETYLVKYRQGRTDRPGAEFKITFDDYVNTHVPAFTRALAPLEIPLYLVCAPEKDGGKNSYNTEWNEAVAAYAHPLKDSVRYGIVLHLYFDGGEYNYGQIQTVRNMFPEGTPVAVTEAGLAGYTAYDYNEAVQLTEAHFRNIAAELREGDYLFDHVLYTNYRNDRDATLHPHYKGISPKGEHVLNWMRDIWPD